jgi:plastocyanin
MFVGGAALALLLASCGGGNGNSGGTSGNTCTMKGGSSSGTAATVVKVLSDPTNVGKFDPQSVSVKVGDSVEWDWNDPSAQHSVTSDDNTTFDSGLCSSGTKFVVSFSKAGTFAYHCSIHSGMTGMVKVG